MFKTLKLLYKFLKEKCIFSFNFISAKLKKGRDLSLNLLISSIINRVDDFALRPLMKDDEEKLVKVATNVLVGKELDKYLKSLRPLMPLLNHDPAIKTMRIAWNSTWAPMDGHAQMIEKLEEQIINRYVRYVSRHIFTLLQPNKHKILLNVTAYEQLNNYQIPIGEQVLYKDPQQVESYLIDHLMGVLISYQANGIENFTYFISNMEREQYEQLSIKIQALFNFAE